MERGKRGGKNNHQSSLHFLVAFLILWALPSLALAPGQQGEPGTLTPEAPETATVRPHDSAVPAIVSQEAGEASPEVGA